MHDFIPKTTSDFEAVNKLREKSIHEVKPFAMQLLEWLQDTNWPIANDLGDYLALNIHEIEDELITILDKENNDDSWKFSILYRVILPNEDRLSEKMLSALKRIYFSPTLGEIDELVHEGITDNFSFESA